MARRLVRMFVGCSLLSVATLTASACTVTSTPVAPDGGPTR